MAIIDLGIPPGFDVDATAFETLQEKGQIVSAGVQKGISVRVQKGTGLERVFSEDFGPAVERSRWGLGDRPELSERVVDQSDRGSLGGCNGPAFAEKVDLVVRVDPSFQMESQMEVQQG